MLLLMSVVAFGQQEVTKFMGIPVDGSKEEMIRQLKKKGFKETIVEDVLEGEFNGTDVYVFTHTINNKVWRIALTDANPVGETDIKIRFNKLCLQFQNNGKYLSGAPDTGYILPDEEDIGYEISVNDKRYEAVFYQMPAKVDSTAMIREISPMLLEKYTTEQLANPTKDVIKDILIAGTSYLYEICSKRSVWFMISQNEYGRYYISMFYENRYNEADGEDL